MSVGENRTVSIRTKLLSVVIAALLFMAILMGTIGILVVNRLAKTSSERIMNRIRSEQSYRLDGKLGVIQHSEEVFYDYLQHIASDQYPADYTKWGQYEDMLEDFALSIANRTDGSRAVYFRYDPELTGSGTAGFFWTRKNDESVFVREIPESLLDYDKSDAEHTGWFYIPKESREALWLSPVYNEKLGTYMISYVIPVFLNNNTFIGVIGMDIDFSAIMKAADSTDFYEKGTLSLVDMDKHVMYNTDANGVTRQEAVSDKLYSSITESNSRDGLLTITDDNGKKSMICGKRLSNGMLLYVNVPYKEIFSDRNQLTVNFIFLTLAVVIVTILIISGSAASIIRPIKQLSIVTEHYAEGDWSIKYINNSSTEIKSLSEGISVMAENTQKYIRKINSIARKDALTGIGNKTAYVELVEEIKQNYKEKFNNYEVFVMDLNLLKKANDTYGHEAGDALLKEAGQYISRTFEHSAVFRIGGDEFVAILLNEDYENRQALTEKFEQGMGYTVSGDFPVKLYISFGGAVYGVESTDYDELFSIADDRMYTKKKEMKMERRD